MKSNTKTLVIHSATPAFGDATIQGGRCHRWWYSFVCGGTQRRHPGTQLCHPRSHVRPSSSPLGPVRRLLPADVVALRLGLPAPLRDHRGGKLGGEYLNLLPLRFRDVARLLREQPLKVLHAQICQLVHHGIRALQLVPRHPAEEQHALSAALHARLGDRGVVPEHHAPLRGASHRGARALYGQRVREPIADVLAAHDVGLASRRFWIFKVPRDPHAFQGLAQLTEALLAVHHRHRHLGPLKQLEEV
mmetsp:Transcript_10871/g.50202  ORF Transcript_10871/g.50202 Transcript_10871/m.50202 type:complete len:247 (-) Transcript_10871:792-1532(-)